MDLDDTVDTQPGVTTGTPHTQARASRPDHDAVAAAIERRLQAEREKAAAAASSSKATFDENHEKRQEFRRMIDPGILRPNPRHVALESLQVHKSYIVCVGS